MSTRPLRIALLAYRGNMQSGGQGIYLWFLARELSRLGHEVHVWVGPPYPDAMPFARRVVHVPNEGFWARRFDRRPGALLPRPDPLRIFEPLNFWEYGATWFGFLPEPFAFSVRAVRGLLACLRAGERFDLVHDVQSLGWALLLPRALGLPVVTTIHHPLSVDRRASFARDRTFREALGTMELYPVGMQAFVARRLDRVLTSSRASGGEIVRDFGVRPERIRMVWNGLDTELFRPLPDVPRSRSELLCIGRASDPTKGVPILLEALAQLPPQVTLTLVDEASAQNPARARARATRHRVAARHHRTGVHEGTAAALRASSAGGGAVALRGLRSAGGGSHGVRCTRCCSGQRCAARSRGCRGRRRSRAAGRCAGPGEDHRHAAGTARSEGRAGATGAGGSRRGVLVAARRRGNRGGVPRAASGAAESVGASPRGRSAWRAG